DDPGAPIEYTALLQPGDYTLNLQPREGASATPYVISLDTGNGFEVSVDLEPNDEPHQARPVPANGNIHGRARDFGDYDWYRLPEIAAATALTIHDEAQVRSVSLVRYADGKTTNEKLEWLREEKAHVGQLQAGARYLLRVAVRGDYAFRLDFAPGPEHESGSRKGEVLAGVTLQVSGEPPAFAAFWHESQSASIPLTVSNDGSGLVPLRLEAATSHPAWTVGTPGEPLDIGAGQSKKVPITLQVAPDAPADMPVRIDFRVVDPHDAQQVASMPALASCGAEPVNPGRIWTLPDALVGGFNVAWSGLGSRVHDAPADSYGARQPWLYDGVTPNDLSWYRVGGSYPLDLTAELAGDGLIPVAGIILDTPQSGGAYGSSVRDFELRLSQDGAVYEKALSATLSQARIPQHFVLPQPVEARFAQFRILSVHDPRQSRVTLGEIGIVADPAASPFAGRRFNLAEPALGGYVAWSRPDFDLYARAESILTEEVERPSLEVDPVLPTEWVIGFHHNRAAQITELQWVDSPGEAKWPRIGSVQVSISMDGPAGPWETLGAWNLDRAAGPVAPFVLPESRWARFVRFVFTGAESAGRWELAETLRILERGVDDGYRSILAEWGQYASESVHEWMQETSEAGLRAAAHAAENDRRGTALRMNAGVQYTDQVQRGSRVAWYRFDVPQDHNRLRFSLTGNPVADVSATLEDETGADIPLEQVSGTGNELVLETLLQGGSSYWLRVEEPVRHVVVAWDNSGSVRPYRPAIYSAINNFVRDIRPGNEFVHLLPFRTGGFLLSDWSDRTGPLMAGLQSYPRRDDDSNAEEYLLRSSTALGIKHGAKAVVLVTDAETFSYDRTPELWHSLSSVRPRVFAVELHRGDGAAHQQDLMQSWADVNNGFYAHFRQQNDLDIAFDRAFCHLRRPVRFYMTADSRFEEPPGPGLLSVSVENAVSANAVELILDASGSMLQRLEGQRRIEIARTVLTDLINKTIPEGTPLALRVFGHRKPDACDTDLASPLQPLERSKVTGIIQATQAMNLAKTPIGESLRLVADDLRGVDGQKLIILITDGEETCDGDPAAAIASLKESGHDVRVNIVGFAIDDAALKAQFEEWSRIGGGLYFSAGSAAELDEALRQALRPKYQVLDGMGAIVASGTAGAEDVELPSGTYTVKILTSPILTFGDVEIRPEETTRISATGED
ncbi:MAG: VWA domain-containing protein, partial [Paracoccaceae bacterium]